MTSKYDLLITLDNSGGILPGSPDRTYYPGQTISGDFNLTVYQPILFDQVRIALLGFSETTYLEGKKTWREKHIFLKEVETLLPAMQMRNDQNEFRQWSFKIPEYSQCEVCNRTELLPPLLAYVTDNDRRVNVSADITYQIEVLVELQRSGDIFFHEKFNLQPIDNGGAPVVPGEKKKGYPHVDYIFQDKSPLFMDDPSTKLFPVPIEKKKSKSSGFRSMFSKSSDSTYNLPLRLQVRPSENSMNLSSTGGPIYLPPIDVHFEVPSHATDLPFLLACGALSKLGEFFVQSVEITAVFGHIELTCAGRQAVIPGKRVVLFQKYSMNQQLDLGLDESSLRDGISFNLVEDLTGSEIEIPLAQYGSQFNKHCNQIARKGGFLIFNIGVSGSTQGKAKELEISVPFQFKGVQIEFGSTQVGHSYDNSFQAPLGPPPGFNASEFSAPLGPPPGHDADLKAPSGPPPGHFSDHKAPSGPPPGHEHDAPSGPPPGHGDHKAPLGPPPGHDADHSAPLGPPPAASNSGQVPSASAESNEAPPPAYTETL